MGIYKTGIWKHNNFNEFVTMEDGSVWMKVFYHNNQGGTVLFSTIDEIRNVNVENKYSVLYMLDNVNFKGSDGKYEFLIRYPEKTTEYNRWKQTNNPCNEYITPTSDGAAYAAGYEAIHIDSTDNYWGGLTRQSEGTNLVSTYLSGSVGHSNWFYAIGAIAKHDVGIPSSTRWGNGIATVVELFVRIDNTPQFSTKSCILNNQIMSTEMIEI